MGTKHKGPEKETRALNAFINLVRASDTINDRLQGPLEESGVTLGQFAVLESLYHLGPMRQVEIASRVLRSKGNVTLVIDNLEKLGLVRREREKDDRRCFTVSITAEGKKRIAEIFPAHVKRLVEQMSVLSATEQETLRTLCRKLGKGSED